MRKPILRTIITLVATLIPMLLCAQEAGGYSVGTTPTKRGALLEEFTGIHCGFCPQGHAIAKKMMRNHPNVYSIAIHSGHYAANHPDEPDFRITEGEALDAFFHPSGYPSGMVSRSLVLSDDDSPVTERSLWPYQAKAIIEQDASVNLLATSKYDGSTGKLSIHVEGYFTAEEQLLDQELMVVWTQGNILGPQSGANQGDDYSHQHMLRQYVTPLWGDTLQSPKQGQYFTRDYEVVVPADIKKVEVVPADIQVLAFVCNGKGEVLNVTSSKPEYVNYSLVSGALEAPQLPIGNRYAFNFFEAFLKNNGTAPITTATFDITINDDKKSVEWSGNIAPGKGADIELPLAGLAIDRKDENEYLIELKTLNGQSVKSSKLKGDFIYAQPCTPDLDIIITTNDKADDAFYRLRDADGAIIKEFGPYPVGEISEDKQQLNLEPDRAYCFEVWCPWGMDLTYPNSTYVMHNSDGSLLAQVLKITDYGSRTFFFTSKPSGVTELPAVGNTPGTLFDLSGRRVTHPTPGLYIQDGKKIIIQ